MPGDSSHDLRDLVSALRDRADDGDDFLTAVRRVAIADDASIEQLLDELIAAADVPEMPAGRLTQALMQLVHRQHESRQPLTEGMAARIEKLYERLGSESGCRHLLLVWLSSSPTPDAWRQFAELFVTDPPADPEAAAASLSPFFQARSLDASTLFPRLLDGLGRVPTAAAILDFANFLARTERVADHPGKGREKELLALLESLVQRLEALEAQTVGDADQIRRAHHQIFESLPLVVALCDAVGLLGIEVAVSKLHHAMQLKHRRIVTEAAAALARLGDPRGAETLVSLASEPVARLRVLAYAEELQLLDLVAEEYRTDASRAEAELALSLAQPAQFGFPPAQLELFDERSLYWPGYSDPVGCFLFRFSYPFPKGTYTNIGIAGPVTHALAADLGDLPPDDIYAVYAGWQAQHEEIYQWDLADGIPAGQTANVSRLERRLRDEGCEDVQPRILGVFFGMQVLVAEATRQRAQGFAASDGNEFHWYPTRGARQALGAAEVYNIYKGRQLLSSFNAEEED